MGQAVHGGTHSYTHTRQCHHCCPILSPCREALGPEEPWWGHPETKLSLQGSRGMPGAEGAEGKPGTQVPILHLYLAGDRVLAWGQGQLSHGDTSQPPIPVVMGDKTLVPWALP